MLPVRLLPHLVTIQEATTETDDYGDTVEDWGNPTETVVNARVEFVPVGGKENNNDRDAALSFWRIMLNDEIDHRARIQWDSKTFLVDGAVAPVYGARTLSHYEGTLKLAD